MIQLGARRADHPPAARAHAQAEVDIIVGDCEVLGFEPAHRVEHRAAQGHAGTSHRRDAAGVAQHPAVARIVARGAAAQMRRNAARADGNAGVLQRAVGIQQPRTDDADVRSLRQGDHLAQPAWVDHLRVVVEQHDDLAARLPHGGVVQRGPVERTGVGQDADAWVCGQAGQQPRGAAFAAVVVQDQHFDRGVVGAVQDPIDAACKQRGMVAGWDDDGDEGVVKRLPLPLRKGDAGRGPYRVRNYTDWRENPFPYTLPQGEGENSCRLIPQMEQNRRNVAHRLCRHPARRTPRNLEQSNAVRYARHTQPIQQSVPICAGDADHVALGRQHWIPRRFEPWLDPSPCGIDPILVGIDQLDRWLRHHYGSDPEQRRRGQHRAGGHEHRHIPGRHIGQTPIGINLCIERRQCPCVISAPSPKHHHADRRPPRQALDRRPHVRNLLRARRVVRRNPGAISLPCQRQARRRRIGDRQWRASLRRSAPQVVQCRIDAGGRNIRIRRAIPACIERRGCAQPPCRAPQSPPGAQMACKLPAPQPAQQQQAGSHHRALGRIVLCHRALRRAVARTSGRTRRWLIAMLR